MGNEGRGGSVGRDNSEYVTAGIVPMPMVPLPRGDSVDPVGFDNLGVGSGLPSSLLDTRSASSKSMRSLHCNSNSLRASTKAFSVSVWGPYPGMDRLAWWSYIC